MNCEGEGVRAGGRKTRGRRRGEGGKGTHDVLVQRHKVEMLDPLVRVLLHLPSERLRADDFAEVLVDEGVAVRNCLKVRRRHEGGSKERGTNAGRSSNARTPNPFFSVLTISMLAYCFVWNLSATKRIASIDREETGK
jgi:hypothetical protein